MLYGVYHKIMLKYTGLKCTLIWQPDFWFVMILLNWVTCHVWVYVIRYVFVHASTKTKKPKSKHRVCDSLQSSITLHLSVDVSGEHQIWDFHVSWHQHINRIKVNAHWLPWWCCYGDQSKGEVSWWVAVCSDSLLPKMRSRERERESWKRAERWIIAWRWL